jgi:DNA-binding NarL/FixJ family response regulator
MVVEDFAPFREFIRSTLGKIHNLRIICEVSDGQEAIQRAEELKPDLILIDIGLPTLNGIASARRICELSPDSKIIFVSHESNPDVVQEALNLGARAYVAKARAGTDLAAAVEAVLAGRRYVSKGLISNDPA